MFSSLRPSNVVRLRRHSTGAAMLLAATPVFIATPHAQAQQARMVVQDDGQAAPVMMMMSMPDFFGLREPDFVRRDVPVFAEQLLLSEPQVTLFEQLIDTYLTDFEQLCLKHLPKMPGGIMRFGGDGPEEGEAVAGAVVHNDEGDGGDFFVAPAIGGAMFGGVGDDDLDPMLSALEGDMPQSMAIGVSVTAGGPDEGGLGGAGGGAEGGAMPQGAPGGAMAVDGGVSVAISPGNGEELTEEQRQRIQEQVSKLAEKLTEEIKRRAEAGPIEGGFERIDPEEMMRKHQEMEARAEEFRKAKVALRQQFVIDAQLQLAGSQVDRWPNLERTLRRAKTLPKGRISGERTDLVRVLREMKLDPAAQQLVAEPAEAYEQAMELALVSRNTNLLETEKQMDQAMQQGQHDKALAAVERATALRVAVRTVNEQFTDTIAAALPADLAATFRQSVLRRSYPNVYRATFGQKTFDAAEKIEGLDDETRVGLAGLEEAYHAELQGANNHLKLVIDRHQPDEPRRPIEHMKAMHEGTARPGDGLGFEDAQHPIREAFAKRRELDSRYARMVREMLTPEQQESLPKPPSRRAGEPIIIEMPAMITAPGSN